MQDIVIFIKLFIMVLVAVGSVLFLLYRERTRPPHYRGIIIGYPQALYPAHTQHHDVLTDLAAVQKRLISVYDQLPPRSHITIWLRTFLLELRYIMDTVYQVVVITDVYHLAPQITQVVMEVQAIEQQIVAQIAQQLLLHEADAQQELLNGRLATLRLCVQELGQPLMS